MQVGQTLTINKKYLNLRPDEFNPKWSANRKIGISAEKQIYETFERWLRSSLMLGETIEVSYKFAPYDFVITHADGTKSYFDIKTRSENSSTWTCSLDEKNFWEKQCRIGNNVFVLCGTNLPNNKVIIDGMWANEDLNIVPSKYEDCKNSCFFSKPPFKNWLLF